MGNNNDFLYLIARLMQSKSVQRIREDIKKLGTFYIDLIGRLNISKTKQEVENKTKGLKITVASRVDDKGVQSGAKTAVHSAQKVANTNKIKVGFELEKEKLINQIKSLGSQNSKLFSDSEMTTKYNNLLDSAKLIKSKAELKNLRKQLSAFRVELIATNNSGLNWMDKLKTSVKRYASFFSGASFVYAMTDQLRNAWQEAKTLDDALVDLQKVTDEINSRDALYKYFDRAIDRAQELNVRVSSLLYAITEFKKMGWSLEDAEIGGEWATKLENVGDVDIDTAIASIRTSIASFEEIGGYGNDQLDKKLEAYVDLINNMSNKYSISAQGISEAIRLSAGTLTEAHTSIEEAAAMFSTANKYYNDPDYLGNTVKIGSLRLRASSGDTSAMEELEEMGENIEELTTATSTLREKLLGLTGVDIMEDDNTFKSYYQQLLEISEVIDKLDDTSRANVLETLFGKNRSAAGAAILSGMKESAGAYQDAITSAGSATKEYEVWMQSADAASQRFANNITEAYQSIIDGNTVRDLSNVGSAILEFANTFGIVEGSLRGIMLLGAGKLITTVSLAFLQGAKSVQQYGYALQVVNTIPNGSFRERFSYLKQLATATKNLTNEQLKQVLSSKNLSQQDRIRILQLSNLSKEAAIAKIEELGLTQATNAQTMATNASALSLANLKSMMIGFGATIKSLFLSNPIGIVLMGISVGVSAISSSISNYNQKIEEAIQKTAQATETWKTENTSLNEKIAKYRELQQQRQDTSLSTEEITSAKQELSSIQNELVDKYGLEAEGLSLVNGKYDEQITKLRQLSAEKAKEYIAENAKVVDDDRKYLSETVAVSLKLGENEFEGLEKYLAQNGLEKVFVPKEGFVISGTGTREELYNQLISLYSSVAEDFGSDTNNPAVKEFQLALSDVINNSFDKDKMEQARSHVEAFAEAEILVSNTGRELYDKATAAVTSYNKALASGEGVEKARKNLESVRAEVDNMTLDIYGAEQVFEGIWSGISEGAKTAAEAVNSVFESKALSKTAMISELNGLSEGFEQLQKIYQSIEDDKEFDFKLLDDDNFKEAFSGLASYADFIEQITSNSDDIDKCKSSFDALVTEWLSGTNVLAGVTEENAKLTESMLRQFGVKNASEVVESALNAEKVAIEELINSEQGIIAQEEVLEAKKRELAIASDDLANITNAEIMSIINEGIASQDTQKFLANLALAKLNVNAQKLNSKSDIDQIIALANAAGTSAEYVEALKTALASLQQATKAAKATQYSAAGGAKLNLTDADQQALVEDAKKKEQTVKDILDSIKQSSLYVSDYYADVELGVDFDGSTKDAKESTKKTFDWIEVVIKRVQRTIANLGKTVSATYKIWTARNDAIKEQASSINEEILIQKQAYDRYMSEANSVGLSKKYKKLVQTGAIDISTISDEELAEKIELYQKYYEAAIGCLDNIQDLEEETISKTIDLFDNKLKEFSDALSLIQHQADMVEEEIAMVETKGYIVNKSYYEELRSIEQDNISTLEAERDTLQTALNHAVANGLEVGSEEWGRLTDDINSVNLELSKAHINLNNIDNELRDLEWNTFDRARDYVNNLTDETERLIELLAEEELFDEKGSITEYGDTVLGLHASNLYAYQSEAKEYAEELADINRQLAEDPYNIELLTRRQELLLSHQEMIKAIRDEKDAMISLASEGYQKMIDRLNDLVDKQKELLNAERDAYNYEKSIHKTNLEIAKLEKIALSLKNDNSIEGQLRKQKNEVALREAQEKLEEQQYEKYLDDSEQMLNQIVGDAEQWVDECLANEEQLLQDILDRTTQSGDDICATIQQYAETLELTLSEHMTNIWSSGGEQNSVVAELEIIEEFVKSMANVATQDSSVEISKTDSKPDYDVVANQEQKSSNNGTGDTNQTNKKGSWGEWFIYKKNSMPKSNLNIDESIVDRLRFKNFDSSFSARAKYYEAMGLGSASAYTGSAKQNQEMIKLMKQNGFKHGGRIGSLIRATGEDGFILAREGEYVFTKEKIEALSKAMMNAQPLINSFSRPLPTISSLHSNTITNKFDMPIYIEGVQDVQGLVTELQKDNRFQKIVQQMTIGNLSGGNSLGKYRYK